MFIKPPLSLDELQAHAELLQLAGGMGCPTELTVLNDQQRQAIQILSKKGYVRLTKKWFMLLLPVD